jgi:hypothetical protein
MTEIPQELRETVRRTYGHRCGYCGVHEEEVGCELEVDHFRPRAEGGSDDISNLVYCCPACNRIKSDFWSVDAIYRLLHPLQDDLSTHLLENDDGRLVALTECGAFHIKRLKLNRPQLIAARLNRLENLRMRQEIVELREQLNQANERVDEIEEELQRMLDLLR